MYKSQYRHYNRKALFEMLCNDELDLPLGFAEQDYWIKQDYWHLVKATDLHTNKKFICAILSAKRGSKKYRRLVLRRLRSRFSSFVDKKFFKIGSEGEVYSHVLSGNLQFNAKLYNSTVEFVELWLKKMSYCFNRWLAVLRSNFGVCAYLRTFEAHLSGFPHIHFVLYFPNHTFRGYSKWSKVHNRYIYRVDDNFGSDFAVLKSAWKWGYCDYEMVSNIGSAIKYIYKYVAKACDRASIDKIRDPDTYMKLRLTLFYNWIFGKRSFDISKMKYFHLPVVPSLVGVFDRYSDENVSYSYSNSKVSNSVDSSVLVSDGGQKFIFGSKQFKKRKDKRFKFEKLGSMIIDYSLFSGRSFAVVNLDWFDVSTITIKKYRLPYSDTFVSRSEWIETMGIDYGCINVDSLYECTYDGIDLKSFSYEYGKKVSNIKTKEVSVYSVKRIIDCKCIVDGSFCHKSKCDLCKVTRDDSQKKIYYYT